MGRWRPPLPPSSVYITPEGFEALQAELKSLWQRRSDVVKALAAAAAEGDRSENAEYIYRKKELGGIDRRIRFLQKRLPNLKVVPQGAERREVYFGAWVTLEKEDGEVVVYRLVGADETDAKRGFISIDSPMARQLLGKRVDDDFRLTIGDREREYVISRVSYSGPG
ncbi:MAG: transcription elongation factor GreB [Pseudomonadota bacterium]